MLLKRRPHKALATQCRHLVKIWERGYADDGQGGTTEVWGVLYPAVWTSITPLNAIRKEEYRTFDVDATHEIKIRGEVEIVEGNNEIVWNGRVFEIKTEEDVQERDIEKIVICLERRV